MTMETLRPRLLAIQPNSQAPSGRIKKPTAKTPAADRSWLARSSDGKNADAKYIAI